jgi:hypothetical protein
MTMPGEREFQEEIERLRVALVESHGSYNSLRAMIDGLGRQRGDDELRALAARAEDWDGPICARRVLESLASDNEGKADGNGG